MLREYAACCLLPSAAPVCPCCPWRLCAPPSPTPTASPTIFRPRAATLHSLRRAAPKKSLSGRGLRRCFGTVAPHDGRPAAIV